MAVEAKPVQLALLDDSEGALMFRDGALVAVLARLGPDHGVAKGLWHIETVFGVAGRAPSEHFIDLEQARSFFR